MPFSVKKTSRTRDAKIRKQLCYIVHTQFNTVYVCEITNLYLTGRPVQLFSYTPPFSCIQ